MFVVECPDADDRVTTAAVVNPVLELPPPPRELDVGDEGCLSVPGQFTGSPRAATAAVRGFDVAGAPIRIEGTGTLARCLQHETDHLDGIVYVDRLPRKTRVGLLRAAGLPTARPGA